MSIKNIVIVDTVGDISEINPDYMGHFPFVKEWFGHQMPGSWGKEPHPHGGFCMGQALLPLWDSEDDIIAHFVRIFDGWGSPIEGSISDWAPAKVAEIAATGPTWVNCSWGAYIGAKDPSRYLANAKPWRELLENNPDITLMWAAGNDGDYSLDLDQDMPQGLLTDVSSKIAAGNKDGVPSLYSSDSYVSPPLATLWSTRVRLLNPVTADWTVGSGTSFAAPKATGLAAARNMKYSDFCYFAAQQSLSPKNYPGPLPHPKWGFGWLEDEYQKEIKDCPYRFEAAGPRDLEDEVSLSWYEFELRNDSKLKKEFKA